MNLELEFTLHEAEEPFFTVQALILPPDPTAYALVDEKTATGMDADGFRVLLQKVRFPKSPKFSFYVIKEGKRRLVTVPLPPWPVSSGYAIRTVRFAGTLKLK